MSLEELRPIELALAEFLVASLAGHDKEGSFSGLTPSQAAIFSRVCRTIEANLADPDLGLTSIAKEERVSPRYLQKLFEAVGQNFSTYLRSRRLERCRAELVNPLYERVSIADVCFRWGFNDPANFSRVFREQYGASPRTFRHEAGLELARHLVRRISRGLPVNAGSLLAHAQLAEQGAVHEVDGRDRPCRSSLKRPRHNGRRAIPASRVIICCAQRPTRFTGVTSVTI